MFIFAFNGRATKAHTNSPVFCAVFKNFIIRLCVERVSLVISRSTERCGAGGWRGQRGAQGPTAAGAEAPAFPPSQRRLYLLPEANLLQADAALP